MKHSSKYVDSSRPNVHEETKVQHRIQNIENKHNCKNVMQSNNRPVQAQRVPGG